MRHTFFTLTEAPLLNARHRRPRGRASPAPKLMTSLVHELGRTEKRFGLLSICEVTRASYRRRRIRIWFLHKRVLLRCAGLLSICEVARLVPTWCIYMVSGRFEQRRVTTVCCLGPTGVVTYGYGFLTNE